MVYDYRIQVVCTGLNPDVKTHCPIVAEWVGQTCFGRLVELPLPSFLRDLCNGALLCSYSHKRSIRSDLSQFQGVYFVKAFFAGPLANPLMALSRVCVCM